MSEFTTKMPMNFSYEAIQLNTWDQLLPWFDDLACRVISSKEDLIRWLDDRSILEGSAQEELGWKYIRQSCDTTDEAKQLDLENYVKEIEPRLQEYNDVLNRKLLDSPFTQDLNGDYQIYLRGIRQEVALFRQENIPLQTELQLLSNEYGRITGSMSVAIDGKEYTFQKAANFLKSENRQLRQEVYVKINQRRRQDQAILDELFDKMLVLRNQIALNAGFSNFRDYMFAELGRFDYSPENCVEFHESIEKHILPLVDAFDQARKEGLGYEQLYPWDSEVDVAGKAPLKPFEDSQELIQKTIACFTKIRSNYGDVIRRMDERGHLDLDSRIGKAPGGYNYPLYKSSLPFIFMHATGSLRDMITMMHEGGHALHSWLSKDLRINAFKHTPSEIAEVASMAMELLSMEHWDVFFQDADELKRAKLYQLEKILSILPWIACVDAFQHWIYTNQGHSQEQRNEAWLRISRRFAGKVVDRGLYPEFETHSWHRQLHIFEVPFYYIEYGIAQLGAIGIWRNAMSDRETTLDNYEKALAEGNMYSLPDLYQHAGIQFDFSSGYIAELAKDVSNMISSLRD